MKRFLLFAYTQYDRDGGMNDLVGTFDTMDALIERIQTGFKYRESTKAGNYSKVSNDDVPEDQWQLISAHELQVFDILTDKVAMVRVPQYETFDAVLIDLRKMVMSLLIRTTPGRYHLYGRDYIAARQVHGGPSREPVDGERKLAEYDSPMDLINELFRLNGLCACCTPNYPTQGMTPVGPLGGMFIEKIDHDRFMFTHFMSSTNEDDRVQLNDTHQPHALIMHDTVTDNWSMMMVQLDNFKLFYELKQLVMLASVEEPKVRIEGADK